MKPVLQVALDVTRILERLDIPYAVVGSIASGIYGLARSTRDVDFVADVKTEHITDLIALMEPLFFVQEESIRQAIRDRSSFNVIHLETMFKADIFIPKNTAADSQQLERRQDRSLPEDPTKTIAVASPEDTILQKLRWYKLGNEISSTQWSDVQGVMKVTAEELDMDYLRETAEQMHISELLERALSDSGLAE